jgi:DNA-binding NarL/FixJ family response regulator
MDVAMPLLNGLEATRQILKALPGTRILVLTSYSDDDCVQQLTEAGISG